MRSLPFVWLAALTLLLPTSALAQSRTSVWKITSPEGRVAYLGGSIHKLRSTDYPLPAAFNRAFDLSQRLAFEVDPDAMSSMSAELEKAGTFPAGDSLRNHVDPRTYAYVVKVFGAVGMPEAKVARLRAWYLHMLIGASAPGGEIGVERYLGKRARDNDKKIEGLATAREHARVYSGLNDKEAEALLLLTFIPQKGQGAGYRDRLTTAWRRGEADQLARAIHTSYADFPAMAERLLGARNRAWIPKIEGYLRSGQVYFIVAGAAHMGGPDGVVALLRARGHRVEQW
ncbi:MAG: TraB/GumN family protein [Verrucomicrobia bacterium]|nr:TraB/GumN family protein [Verrucomicrobiota bacterium]